MKEKKIKNVQEMFEGINIKNIDEQSITIYGTAILDVIEVLNLIATQQKEIEGLKQDNKKLDKENQSLFEAYNFNDTNLLAKILKEYRKEIKELKEKTKKCEYYEMVADELSKELEELKDKFLDEKIRNTVIKRYREVIEKDYVDKVKIKSKIEEYDDKGMTVNLANRSAGKTFRQAVNYEVREVLQSLLEEE